MFRDPWLLVWMLPALALAAGAAAWGAARRRRLAALMGEARTLSRLVPDGVAARRKLRLALRLSALALLFVALAGPQWGVELVATQSAGHQVIVAVDTSLSMLTEDVKPSRLERAKQELSLLLEQLRGDRVGVVAFSGEAAVVCPLTTDIDAAKQLLRSIEQGMIPVPGTGIGKAIRLATQSLARYPGTKTLVLLSDGEDHKTDPGGAAEQARAAGVRIYAVGIGTVEGEPIPLRDAAGGLTGYKKDRKGATVISKLGEATLTEAAQKTDGAYFRISPGQNEAGEIADRIEKSERSEGVGGTANTFQNRFMIPLSLAFALLLLELVLTETGGLRPNGTQTPARGSAARGALVAALVVMILPSLGRDASSATTEGALRKGNKLYGKEQYVPALEAYSQAAQKAPADPRPVFNSGDALYRLDELDKAADAFRRIAQSNGPAAMRSAGWYNLGNVDIQKGDIPQAIADYRESVKLNPADKDAVNNLAAALDMLKHPPPPRKNKPKDKKQDDKKDKNDGEKPKDDKGSPAPTSQPKTRPQDQLSGEDAQRIMRAVAEKEKASGNSQRQFQKAPAKKPDVEEDW